MSAQTLSGLQILYPDFSEEELRLFDDACRRSGLNPFLHEIRLMRDEDGRPSVYLSTRSVVADLQDYCASRGATCWFRERRIVDEAERRQLGLAEGDIAFQVELRDTLGQADYARLYRELREAGYPHEEIVADIGRAPAANLTTALGIVRKWEVFDARFHMTRDDYAIKRGRRAAAEARLPMTAMQRVSLRRQLAEMDALPAPEPAPAAPVPAHLTEPPPPAGRPRMSREEYLRVMRGDDDPFLV